LGRQCVVEAGKEFLNHAVGKEGRIDMDKSPTFQFADSQFINKPFRWHHTKPRTHFNITFL